MSFQTIPEMFWTNTEKYSDQICYGYKEDGTWKTYSYQKVGDMVETLAAGLASLGVDTGDTVSIISDNSPRWAIADFAILSLAGITVPVYPTLIPNQIKYLLNDADIQTIFTQNRAQTEKILEIYDDVETLKHIIIMDNDDSFQQEYVYTWDDIRQKGKESDLSLESRWKDLTGDDHLTYIYTSGTTGEPKGVILTHGNMTSNVDGGLERLDVGSGDRFLSFLPLSHSFERMAGHFLPFTAGCSIYYAESIDTVPQNMGEVKPTVMTSVPRLYEKMYIRVNEAVHNSSVIRKNIFQWAFGVGERHIQAEKEGNVSGLLKFQHNLAEKLVFSKLKERVGGAIRFFVSGGAPLSADIARFFEKAGILILEGYGLTETSPVIAVNGEDNYRIGTVGQPIYNVEVKIAEDGEILSRGPHIMEGYYGKPEATKESIDDDGWFHTGDIGALDDDGFLSVTDRKKNIIVTSGGKNVAPQPIENALLNSQFIEQVMLIGDKRNFVSALIVPSFDNLREWANQQNLYYGSDEELIQLGEVNEFMREELEKHQEEFARYEKVKEFRLLPRELTIENDELTPTLKIKRRVVQDEFSDLIEDMYTNANSS
ncbi:MAG: AMP-binding protein [Candidatus Marinimicrobia bacterium]|nr:AMP-binding protein [Candidatus Neomarinimicrobiota bacterium]